MTSKQNYGFLTNHLAKYHVSHIQLWVHLAISTMGFDPGPNCCIPQTHVLYRERKTKLGADDRICEL